jgi:hypothetical protein
VRRSSCDPGVNKRAEAGPGVRHATLIVILQRVPASLNPNLSDALALSAGVGLSGWTTTDHHPIGFHKIKPLEGPLVAHLDTRN